MSSNATITADLITVHGRGSLELPYKVQDKNGVQQDISTWVLRFEVDGLSTPISELLVADPNDSKGQLIVLDRTKVAQLNKTPTNFSLINETRATDGIYTVLWSGTIGRIGYLGAPDTDPSN